MRRILAMSAVLVVLGLATSVAAGRLRAPAAKSEPAASLPGARLDPTKTLGYLAEWARRDRWDAFPESPAFAFYNLYATRALGGAVSPALRSQVTDYLSRCQAADGGFTMAPGRGESHVVPTHFALRALALLGALDAVDRPRAAAFLSRLARTDGGYVGRAVDEEVSLGTTYHALAALELLGALDRVDRGRSAAYVSSHCTVEGGFALRPGMIASPAGTFMAVRALKLLGPVAPQTSDAAVRYLSTSRYSGRVREGAFAGLPEVEDEAHVLAALADLGRLDVVDRAEVERFLTSLYVAENGGFGPQPGLGTTPPSTYHAVACLVELGRLPDPARLGAAR
jgi:geranylgeranyl transferase type-2 subunit beta